MVSGLLIAFGPIFNQIIHMVNPLLMLLPPLLCKSYNAFILLLPVWVWGCVYVYNNVFVCVNHLHGVTTQLKLDTLPLWPVADLVVRGIRSQNLGGFGCPHMAE